MRAIALTVFLAFACFGHPMGNLSVNHYARLQVTGRGVEVKYVLDLAEIPTFELMQTWGVEQGTPKDTLQRKAREQAAEWLKNVQFTENGNRAAFRIQSTTLTVIDGAGNLPVFRIESQLHVTARPGTFQFEDDNYPTRNGWREIVVAAGDGAAILRSTNTARDLSQGLTAYPQDPTAAPPQDKKATIEWQSATLSSRAAPAPPHVEPRPPAKPEVAAPVPVPSRPESVGPRPPEQPSAGTIQRGDRMSQLLQMLRNKDMSWSVFGILLVLAFWFGALHALEPGHGKTMAAAYLVGSRGTPKHAFILGGAVTFTHTISVFVLGLGTMFLSQYVMPDKITKWLGVLSGLSIVWIGVMLFWKRLRVLALAYAEKHYLIRSHHGHHKHGQDTDVDHAYAHAHGLAHSHAHRHSVEGAHDHSHSGLTHTHDGQTHSHMPEGDISMSSLIALGASGGIAPCPSALILLLSAISIGRPGLGVVLLIAFSLGLAIVLTVTGLTVLYARNLLPESKRQDNAFFRYMPVISAAAIVAVGILMTGVSMGWFPAVRFFS